MIRRLATATAAMGVLLMSSVALPAAAATDAVQVPPENIRLETDRCDYIYPDLGEYDEGNSDFEVTGVTGPLRATGEEDQVMASYITVCAEGEGEGTVDYTIERNQRTLVGTINVEAYTPEIMVEEPIDVVADEEGYFSFKYDVVAPSAGSYCSYDDNVWDLEDRAGRLADPSQGAVIECGDDRHWAQTVNVLTYAEGEELAAEEEAAKAEQEAREAAEAEAEREEAERAVEEAQRNAEARAAEEAEEPADPTVSEASEAAEPTEDDDGTSVALYVAVGLLVVGGAGYFIWKRKVT